MSKILPFAVLATSFLLMPANTQASHYSPLSRAANNYREAALHFGHEVIANPRLTQFERRLAPQLVEAAGRFYVVARHPDQSQHLRSAWIDIESMHRQVELVLFNHPGCPVYNALWPCWQDVLFAYNELSLQLSQLGCHDYSHGHVGHDPRAVVGYPIGRMLPMPPLPQVKQQSYRYRDTPIISYRYGTLPHSVAPPRSESRYSPSEHQISDSEQHIERATSRRQLDHGRIGAILSRRVD